MLKFKSTDNRQRTTVRVHAIHYCYLSFYHLSLALSHLSFLFSLNIANAASKRAPLPRGTDDWSSSRPCDAGNAGIPVPHDVSLVSTLEYEKKPSDWALIFNINPIVKIDVIISFFIFYNLFNNYFLYINSFIIIFLYHIKAC